MEKASIANNANTGQYYIITLNDTENFDGDIETTVILAFHDEQHRRVAASFWKFWLGQQMSTTTARAIDIGKLCQNPYQVLPTLLIRVHVSSSYFRPRK